MNVKLMYHYNGNLTFRFFQIRDFTTMIYFTIQSGVITTDHTCTLLITEK